MSESSEEMRSQILDKKLKLAVLQPQARCSFSLSTAGKRKLTPAVLRSRSNFQEFHSSALGAAVTVVLQVSWQMS